ncbi:NDR1/HIN1-like protein 6 [Aristolochia californica]|uniref:NDR1/HIN1-like protein 6 n=1 Tax=Aristolochia californica TaxID=171875 RepID=UPI0035E1D83C
MGHHHQHGAYPMDVESSYMHPAPNYGPGYVMLSEHGSDHHLRPPPYRRKNIPRYHSKMHSHRRGGCCCCICCCCTFLMVFLLLLLLLASYVYFFIKPKPPNYKISNMKIAAFHLNSDFSLYTEFNVAVRAENPNDNVAIIYGHDGAVAVTYTGSTLCYGKLPTFYQGHHNTTTINVGLKGKSEFGSGLQSALMDNKRKGRIPLDIYVRVPFSVEVGSIRTSPLKAIVHCALVVDNLSPNRKVNIISSKYDVEIKY